MEQIEKYILIAKRVPPGDRWSLINTAINSNEDNKVYNSLTETLEAFYQTVNTPYDFKLSPLKGELYIITTENIAPPPPKKFNIYGDY
jgi:hypothetical protein